MPIQPSIHLKTVSDDEFAIIDKSVMENSYAVHNKFGRLFDERVYENELAARLRSEGLDVHTQVPILVTHSGFQKTYRLDLIVNHVIYELKVVASLTHEHEAQALHYAMLHDVRLAKLINFGDKKVHGKLLSNAVLNSDRYQPRLRNSGMLLITSRCERLFAHLKEIIHDWGTHLASHLYNEALTYHLGGAAHCLQRLEVQSGTLTLGTHPVQLLIATLRRRSTLRRLVVFWQIETFAQDYP